MYPVSGIICCLTPDRCGSQDLGS